MAEERSVERKAAIVDTVMLNNTIRLCEIHASVIVAQGAFRIINVLKCVMTVL